jgi:hypothetical protein
MHLGQSAVHFVLSEGCRPKRIISSQGIAWDSDMVTCAAAALVEGVEHVLLGFNIISNL